MSRLICLDTSALELDGEERVSERLTFLGLGSILDGSLKEHIVLKNTEEVVRRVLEEERLEVGSDKDRGVIEGVEDEGRRRGGRH